MKSNKGITLVSLIMYMILTMMILGILIALATNFRENLSNMDTATMQDTEFDKLNLQLLKETKTENNFINVEQTTSTKLVFTNENIYTYVASDKAVYLNNYIKVAENIESCNFEIEETGNKTKLTVTVKIDGVQRTTEYLLRNNVCANSNINCRSIVKNRFR